MPTYEYACDSCGNNFDVFQKMSEAALDTCPECGKKVRRVLSGGVGISFKGSGFYVNDASNSKPKEKAAPAPCASCASSSK